MKTLKLSLLLLLSLTSCTAPKATAFIPHGAITRNNRYTATWGEPTVRWMDHFNGHHWESSYKDFFRYCGNNHPNQLGITVKGQLPDLAESN